MSRESGGMNRRDALGRIMAGAGAVGVSGAVGAHEFKKWMSKSDSEKEDAPEGSEERPTRETFELGDLAGVKNGGLAEWYLGTKDPRLPEQLEISFPKNLVAMWNEKLARLPESVSDAEAGRLADFGNARAVEYLERWKRGSQAVGVPELPQGITTRPYFTHLVNEFSKTQRALIERLDWTALADRYGFTAKEDFFLNMLGHLASEANGRALVAYSMTELMPYAGDRAGDNVKLYDFLARTAGTSFLVRIPSVFDSALSFGPFQFTPYAIEGGIANRHSGLATNHFAPEDLRVPQTLEAFAARPEALQLRDHAAAAFLFGLQNVAIATRSLMDRNNIAALEALGAMDSPTFAAVLAMHHHRPSAAHAALVEWAEAVARGNHERSYEEYAPEEVAHYGRVSKANYKAVDDYFASQSKHLTNILDSDSL